MISDNIDFNITGKVTKTVIHKIWSMRIRIQDNKFTNLISNNLLKVKKKNQISN